MDTSIGSDIFNTIKNHLRVTWDYQDEEIQEHIVEGVSKIENIAGPTDFTVGLAILCLKAFCRYAWDGSEAFFEENYKRELLQLQFHNLKKAYKGV